MKSVMLIIPDVATEQFAVLRVVMRMDVMKMKPDVLFVRKGKKSVVPGKTRGVVPKVPNAEKQQVSVTVLE